MRASNVSSVVEATDKTITLDTIDQIQALGYVSRHMMETNISNTALWSA